MDAIVAKLSALGFGEEVESIKDIKAENERIKAENERIKAESERIKAESERIKAERASARTFVKDALPPLGPHMVSTSSKSTPRRSKDKTATATVYQHEFKTIKDLDLYETGKSYIWDRCQGFEDLGPWNGESTIQSFVTQTIDDAIAAGGFNRSDLAHYENVSMGQEQIPDVLFVRPRRGIPIGVVEIKKPDDRIMTNRLLYGQLYKYMEVLRAFFGLRYVFGIATTYDQWRICWLPDTDSLAFSDTTEPLKNHTVRPRRRAEPDSGAVQETKPRKGKGKGKGKGARGPKTTWHVGHLYASKIYQHDDPELPSALVSALKKMYPCCHDPARVLGLARRPRVVMKPEKWVILGPRPIELRYDVMPGQAIKDFCLLQDLGGGGDGRAWKAAAGGGEVCVLKFALPDADQEEARRQLEEERWCWLTAWGIQGVRVTRLHGQPVLVMPFARSLPDAKRSARQNGRLPKHIRKAIAQMARAGLEHADLRWRHVGEITVTGSPTVVFFDLARVKRFAATNKAKVAVAIATMTQTLMEGAGDEADQS